MTTLRPSERLRFKIELAEPLLDRLALAFWEHPRLEQIFPEYLRSLYWSMQATVPLLALAGERARSLAAAGDALAARLAPYLAGHAEEERDHDAWLLDDIAALGIARQAVLASLPPADVAAMVGAQYFWIRHAHPIALLGCFAVLEGRPVEGRALDALRARTALPPEALRTIAKHALLDPEHRDDLDRLVDELPLSAAHEALLGLSALTTVGQLAAILERLVGEGAAVET